MLNQPVREQAMRSTMTSQTLSVAENPCSRAHSIGRHSFQSAQTTALIGQHTVGDQ